MELYLEVLREDPADRRVTGLLLDQLAAPSSDEGTRIQHYFSDAENLARARAVLEAAIRETPRRSQAWPQLAVVLRIAGDGAGAERSAARATAFRVAEQRRESTVGRVLSAAVYHFADAAKGLVHEVWATRRPTAPGEGGYLEEIFGNLTPEFALAVRNIFLSVREYAFAKLPHLSGGLLNFNYAYKVTKEDEPSGGLSAGLPSALAFLSAFIDRPVPQDIAASGTLVTDAHDVLVVARVGEAEFKVRGAYNRNLRCVLLPEGSRADVERSHHVPRAVVDDLVRFVGDLDAAVSFIFGDDVWVR